MFLEMINLWLEEYIYCNYKSHEMRNMEKNKFKSLETITEDDGEKFVLKEAQFDLGNLGVGTEYSPSVDLNIMNIYDC